MRIVLLADYYGKYLQQFYGRHAGRVEGLSYEAHQELLFSDYFGSFVSYRNHLRKLGNECHLIVGNDFRLQNKWLAENGYPADAGAATQQEVIFKQVRAYGPDAFLTGSMFQYFGELLRKVARVTPNVFAWIAVPFRADLDLLPVRCVLSSVPEFVRQFRERGVQSEQLLASFDRDVIERLGPVQKEHDLSFVGGICWKTHQERVRVLQELVSRGLPLRLWGYLSYGGRLSRAWHGLFPGALAKASHGEAWGLEMYRTLAASRITVNVHIDVARALSMGGNMRLYEATGCGALVVTDDSEDVKEYFEPEKEVVTYRNVAELCEKVRYYLDHRSEAETIAAAGQTACWRRHGYEGRVRQLQTVVEKYSV